MGSKIIISDEEAKKRVLQAKEKLVAEGKPVSLIALERESGLTSKKIKRLGEEDGVWKRSLQLVMVSGRGMRSY